MAATMLDRARRGAAFLDEMLGRGWRRRIRRRRLDMTDGVFMGPDDCGCIIAQLNARPGLVGTYAHGCQELGFPPYSQRAAELGFTVGSLDDPTAEDMTDAWAKLNEAWLTVLREGPS